jgi:hypothetical protein
MLTLAGFDKKQETINALKASKKQLVEAHDNAIKQAEKGLPIDEGLMTGLRAALATVASGTVKATKSLAKQAVELGDNIKKMYTDEKAKIELKDMLKGMVGIAGSFETLEKKAPTIIKKDERVREIVKVFRDAMETMMKELEKRSIAPTLTAEVAESMTESEIKALLEQFLAEDPKTEKLDFPAWQAAIKKAHPEYASKIQFKGRVENGKKTVSAEVPGLDRSFGVWTGDEDDGEGVVLGESN